MSADKKLDTAVLGGGCFWCTEAVFEALTGVHSVTSGYSGGASPEPTYEQVCNGRTGHAECVRIEYDADVISFADLLQVFFHTHDPTTLNRQGNDVGTQYRSVIFCQNPEQQRLAEATIASLNNSGKYRDQIVTELVGPQPFYSAETYHQQYYAGHPAQPYCAAVIGPKMDKFRREFAHLLKRAT